MRAARLIFLLPWIGCQADRPGPLFGSGGEGGGATSAQTVGSSVSAHAAISSAVSASAAAVSASVAATASGSGATSTSAALSSAASSSVATSAAVASSANSSALSTTAVQSASHSASVAASTASTTANTTAVASSSSGIVLELCFNQLDDDQDGFVDCADPDCKGLPGCPPTSWICDPSAYNQGPFFPFPICDCECGAPDPDCDSPLQLPIISACLPGAVCIQGVCVNPPPETCGNGVDDDADGAVDCADTDCLGELGCPPADWTCLPAHYDEPVDACDCGCGVVDPDCADSTFVSCEYCDQSGSCAEGASCANINALNNATCVF